MVTVYKDEWRLVALASLGIMLALFLKANEPEGGASVDFYIFMILYWVGASIFLGKSQGIGTKYGEYIAYGAGFGAIFVMMNAWQPSIFRLGLPYAVESIRFYVICILAPIGEEIGFRQGLYLITLRARMSFAPAAFFSSAIFSAYHWVAYGFGVQTGAFVGAFAFGMIACYMTERTQNPAASTIMHGIVNTYLYTFPYVVFGAV